MNRRTFLRALLASTAVAVVPAFVPDDVVTISDERPLPDGWEYVGESDGYRQYNYTITIKEAPQITWARMAT